MKYVAGPVSYDISVDSDTNSSGDIYNRTYYMDWSKLPKADRWQIEFTFQSSVVTGLASVLATGPICVHMDQLQGAYQFQAGASSSPTHSVFGFLVPNFISATDGTLGADVKQNGAVILDTLPTQPFFTVKLRYGFGTTPPSAFASDYVMTLECTPLYRDEDD
jgi:hypothetical protein